MSKMILKKQKFIPVNEPLLIGNEKKYLEECIDTGWISSDGPFVKKFEQEFAKKVDRKFGVSVCNGTAALDVAVRVLGIKKDDEVIMPTFTIISCAAAVVRVGAIPVLVDCDIDSWNMDVSQVEKKITKKTKAIMFVHIYGLPVDMDPILELAKKYKLFVIEDAAQAIGLKYKNKPCGSFGDVSVVSFYPNKHVTTGEGGMVLTNNKELEEKARSLRNLCFQPNKRFIHEELGFNYRMTNMQAAVGLAQLEQLDTFLIKKRKIGNFYNKFFKSKINFQLPIDKTDFADNYYWVYGLVLPKNSKLQACDLIRNLQNRKIGCRPFFWPMHEQPVFEKMGLFGGERYINSEYIARKGFYIPSGLGMKEDQQKKVIDTILEVGNESIQQLCSVL